MGIINDLDKLIIREDDDFEEMPTVSKIVSKIDNEDDDGGIDDLFQHMEAIQKAAEYIDDLTTEEGSDLAFEVEVALRKAISKMQDLSKTLYKKKTTNNKEI